MADQITDLHNIKQENPLEIEDYFYQNLQSIKTEKLDEPQEPLTDYKLNTSVKEEYDHAEVKEEKSDDIEYSDLQQFSITDIKTEDIGLKSPQYSEPNVESYERYQCPKCKYTPKSEETFKKHIETCRNIQYRCSQCPFTSNYKTCLNRHILTHSRSVTSYCSKCKISFESWSSLRNHDAEVHSKSPQFSCPHCSKHFRSISGINIHIRRFHASCLP